MIIDPELGYPNIRFENLLIEPLLSTSAFFEPEVLSPEMLQVHPHLTVFLVHMTNEDPRLHAFRVTYEVQLADDQPMLGIPAGVILTNIWLQRRKYLFLPILNQDNKKRAQRQLEGVFARIESEMAELREFLQ